MKRDVIFYVVIGVVVAGSSLLLTYFGITGINRLLLIGLIAAVITYTSYKLLRLDAADRR
ncbi:hypothetical protein [Alkalicoccus chagannorensis]|uniref:hypothetical protein n=1 Tax=Alkalicoccus chagannorensis TaxID=427072 RepID=UPI0004098C5C|nr:hypothetical protein [Alkalicoccus chagannorensis]